MHVIYGKMSCQVPTVVKNTKNLDRVQVSKPVNNEMARLFHPPSNYTASAQLQMVGAAAFSDLWALFGSRTSWIVGDVG